MLLLLSPLFGVSEFLFTTCLSGLLNLVFLVCLILDHMIVNILNNLGVLRELLGKFKLSVTSEIILSVVIDDLLMRGKKFFTLLLLGKLKFIQCILVLSVWLLVDLFLFSFILSLDVGKSIVVVLIFNFLLISQLVHGLTESILLCLTSSKSFIEGRLLVCLFLVQFSIDVGHLGVELSQHGSFLLFREITVLHTVLVLLKHGLLQVLILFDLSSECILLLLIDIFQELLIILVLLLNLLLDNGGSRSTDLRHTCCLISITFFAFFSQFLVLFLDSSLNLHFFLQHEVNTLLVLSDESKQLTQLRNQLSNWLL